MKILYISYENPYFPGGTGGQTRQFNLLKELCDRHSFYYVGPRIKGEQLVKLKEICHTVTMPDEITLFDRVAGFVANRIDRGYPRVTQYMEIHRLLLQPLISRLLREEKFDLIQVEHSNIAHWIRSMGVRLPKILVAHNVKTMMWKRYCESASGGEKKQLCRDYERFRKYEAKYLRDYDGVVAMSEFDRKQLAELTGGEVPVFIVPNGVDTNFFKPANSVGDPNELVFTGSMLHPPNDEAALYFCNNILPLITVDRPQIRLSIVGSSPSANVKALARHEGITVTGFVDDTRPYIDAAAVVVVPILSGSGTRLKILEAMAMGKAVVSTSIGAEGIDYVDGENIVIADDPAAFARKTLELLSDPARRLMIGTNGRRLAEDRYAWHLLAAKLEDVYIQVTACTVK